MVICANRLQTQAVFSPHGGFLGAVARESQTTRRPAAAQTRLDDILARGVLRVGATGDYPPFAVRGADGAYSGLDVDAAQALGAALGVKVEFVPTRWADLTHDLAAGAFDIAMGGVSVTLERQKTAFFSAPYLRDGKTPIARCADKDRFADLAAIDRPEVTVIVNPGGMIVDSNSLTVGSGGLTQSGVKILVINNYTDPGSFQFNDLLGGKLLKRGRGISGREFDPF